MQSFYPICKYTLYFSHNEIKIHCSVFNFLIGLAAALIMIEMQAFPSPYFSLYTALCYICHPLFLS